MIWYIYSFIKHVLVDVIIRRKVVRQIACSAADRFELLEEFARVRRRCDYKDNGWVVIYS